MPVQADDLERPTVQHESLRREFSRSESKVGGQPVAVAVRQSQRQFQSVEHRGFDVPKFNPIKVPKLEFTAAAGGASLPDRNGSPIRIKQPALYGSVGRQGTAKPEFRPDAFSWHQRIGSLHLYGVDP